MALPNIPFPTISNQRVEDRSEKGRMHIPRGFVARKALGWVTLGWSMTCALAPARD